MIEWQICEQVDYSSFFLKSLLLKLPTLINTLLHVHRGHCKNYYKNKQAML